MAGHRTEQNVFTLRTVPRRPGGREVADTGDGADASLPAVETDHSGQVGNFPSHLTPDRPDRLVVYTYEGCDPSIRPVRPCLEEAVHRDAPIPPGQWQSMPTVEFDGYEQGVDIVSIDEPYENVALAPELSGAESVQAVDDAHRLPLHDDRRQWILQLGKRHHVVVADSV